MNLVGLVKPVLVAGFWIPLVFCTYMALSPSPLPTPPQVTDVLLHAAAFTYLSAALAYAHLPYRLSLVAVWMFAYGIAIELVQALIAERSAEFKDLVMDVVGITLGLGFTVLTRDFVLRLLPGQLPRKNRSA